ncbi:glycosyl transferase [Flavobacterium noncentrifugens]|uniref:Glycosyltransferase involved in cell wall bisynthesis n=1 Tax=Flavobacterium noncentrifugens TaxID=1128970 RepID=A0A1G8V7M6_9FLAO|nr:glycosyltransferase family 4 protein [Flavobacterium noncentrifugens]GEP50378.1 glycosyl transferase [Flavobacterium noncentrifugens]SDJ62092.1 Glycosyltransferase involved in cell wall bisynthesis [Flavobacterium noncentrifugens]
MRIIYITDQVYLHGGAEKILIQKLNYWVEHYGYDVLLITSQQLGKKSFLPLNEKVQWMDLEINYEEGVSFLSLSNLKKFPGHISKLKKAIHDFKPDAVFLISLNIIRYALPFISGKYKIFNEYHTSYYGFELNYERLSFVGKIKRRLSYVLTAFVESFYTKIVFLNDAEYKHYNRKNAVIIPNFFDEIKDLPNLPKKNQIISLGRLCFQKGYDLLIDAWEIVDRERTGWTLEIFGNGEDHKALVQQIEAKKLSHSLHLNPATDQINYKLSESQFYVMSSRFETFPMVLLEAMSNKLPTVSFDCPTGPASMLTPGEDGVLVQNGDVNALAQQIILLIRDEKRRTEMSENALKNVARFNVQHVMELWDKLIKTS